MRIKRSLVLAFLLVLYIGPVIFISSYGPSAIPTDVHMTKDFSIASDWYESWIYRRNITITGSAGAGTDYQVRIPVTYNSHMQADFDDIRFTDNDTITLLDYWRESYIASTSAVFWVEVADDLGSNQNISMYYGSSAGSLSNGETTFLFYEDWSSQSKADWTVHPVNNHGQTTYSPTDATHGGYVAKNEANAASNYILYSDLNYTAPFATMFRVNIEEAAAGNVGRAGTGFTGLKSLAYVETLSTGEKFAVYDDDGNDDSQAMTNTYFDTWVKFEITRDGTNATLYADDILIETASFAPDIISYPVMFIQVTDSEQDLYSDWVAVRKFITTEPAFDSFGDEEERDRYWNNAGTAILTFSVLYDPWAVNVFLIFFGLCMIPISVIYLVKGGKDDMSMDKVFYGIVVFIFGWALFLGGIFG